MKSTTTEEFFNWTAANNLSRNKIADLLGVKERSLSTYRSRGLPEKKIPLAAKIMSEWGKSIEEKNNKLNIQFSDEEMDIVEHAADIVGTPLREYMRRAVIARARQDANGARGKAAG